MAAKQSAVDDFMDYVDVGCPVFDSSSTPLIDLYFHHTDLLRHDRLLRELSLLVRQPTLLLLVLLATKPLFPQPSQKRYKAGKEVGPIYGLWPGSCLSAIAALKSPRWEDYEYTLIPGEGRTTLSWLGVGCAEAETMEGSDKAPYLSEIDYPPVPQ